MTVGQRTPAIIKAWSRSCCPNLDVRSRSRQADIRTATVLLFLISAPGLAQSRYARTAEAILGAWSKADVVCLGENHGRFNDSELRIALVKHPDFASVVRLIVVEFANPVHQDLLDRFVLDGAVLTREEIAPIWRDANFPEVWESAIYEQFLRAVRELNIRLPVDKRVRVIGGDGPIDWSRISKPEDLIALVNRGANIRNIVAQQVLDRKVKALAIYGANHCAKAGGGFPGDLATKYSPSRMWSVWPLATNAANELKQHASTRDVPSYLVVKGTPLETLKGGLVAASERFVMGDLTDAVIFHGSVPDSVVRSDPTILMEQHGKEIRRRRRLMAEAYELWTRR